MKEIRQFYYPSQFQRFLKKLFPIKQVEPLIFRQYKVESSNKTNRSRYLKPFEIINKISWCMPDRGTLVYS